MLPSGASELAKQPGSCFGQLPDPHEPVAQTKDPSGGSYTTSPTRRAICQTSIFLEALTLPSAPRRLVEPTPLPIGRQAYTMLARSRGRLVPWRYAGTRPRTAHASKQT